MLNINYIEKTLKQNEYFHYLSGEIEDSGKKILYKN